MDSTKIFSRIEKPLEREHRMSRRIDPQPSRRPPPALFATPGRENIEMNTNTRAQTGAGSLPYMYVLFSGLATTALTLLLVYLLNARADINLMGYYFDYVLPAGAMGVGILAGSGYGVMSWIAGVKIPRTLLWTIIFLQCVAYFYAQYIVFEHLHLVYSSTNQPVGFFEYFDWSARSFAFKEDNGETGNAMGAWGYAFRLLEVSGFAFTALLIPVWVSRVPYCDSCGRYMRRKAGAVMPGSVPFRKIKKSDTHAQAAYKEEGKQAVESAANALKVLGEMAGSGQIDALNNAFAALAPGRKAAHKLPVRHVLSLYFCPTCASGQLNVVPVSGHGKRMRWGKTVTCPIPGGRAGDGEQVR